MGDAGVAAAGVAPGASETTPLIPPAAGGGDGSGTPPRRENSATSGGHKNPFYGALRRTRRVAKALTNPWPKVREAAAAPCARRLKPTGRATADLHARAVCWRRRPALRLRLQRHSYRAAGAAPAGRRSASRLPTKRTRARP